jgi:hypothetical protein
MMNFSSSLLYLRREVLEVVDVLVDVRGCRARGGACAAYE